VGQPQQFRRSWNMSVHGADVAESTFEGPFLGKYTFCAPTRLQKRLTGFDRFPQEF
jgi:hypothetical protein